MIDRFTLEAAERRIGYSFREPRLLLQALTHSSGKTDAQPSNERLEFLGDSILGAIIARHLFLANDTWDEGELTRVKSAVVSAATLADASLALGLPEFFHVGKGLANQERFPTSLLANVFEALVAAIYLDRGMEAAERFVLASLGPTIEQVIHEGLAKNWKSILQQYAQKAFGTTPHYRVSREEGPDHGKRFEVTARIGDREFGRGEGRSKKEAEQRAAEATLRELLGPRADMAGEGFAAPATEPTAESAGAAGVRATVPSEPEPADEFHVKPLDPFAPPLRNPPPPPPVDGPPGEDEDDAVEED